MSAFTSSTRLGRGLARVLCALAETIDPAASYVKEALTVELVRSLAASQLNSNESGVLQSAEMASCRGLAAVKP